MTKIFIRSTEERYFLKRLMGTVQKYQAPAGDKTRKTTFIPSCSKTIFCLQDSDLLPVKSRTFLFLSNSTSVLSLACCHLLVCDHELGLRRSSKQSSSVGHKPFCQSNLLQAELFFLLYFQERVVAQKLSAIIFINFVAICN